MRATLSPLQVKAFFFEKLKLEENPRGTVKHNLDIDFNVIEDESGTPGIQLFVKYNTKAKNPIIRLDVEAISLFEIEKSLPEMQRKKLLFINGLVITYGLVRGVVYQMCSVIPPSQRLLPSIDFTPLLKEKAKG